MGDIKLSTGLKQALAYKGWKETLNDVVLVIYSGSPPTSADNAETGTRLVTFTIDGNSFSRSTKREDFFAVTAVGDDGDTITITITPDSGDTETYTYTKSSSESTTSDVVRAIVSLMADSQIVDAIAVTETTEKGVKLVSKFAGDNYSVTVTPNGNIATSPSGSLTPTVANVRGNGLHLEYISEVSGGIIEKNASDTWQGEVQTSGTAQWFRIIDGDDGGGASTTAIRLQGICGVSDDADLQLVGTASLTAGTTVTIDTFRLVL